MIKKQKQEKIIKPVTKDVSPSTGVPEQSKVLIEKTFLEDIRKTMDELKADNAMLKQIADKSRMSDFYIRNKERMPEQYRLRTIRVNDIEKVILGWKMIKDDVYVDNNKIVENQVILLVLEDGSQKEISQTDFVRLYDSVKCSKISDKNDNGSLILKLQRNDNAKIYEVDVKFVN